MEDHEAVVTEVYNLDEAQLVSGLIMMAGIPVKLEHEAAGELFGLSVGPLARIKIIVPADKLEDAQAILAGQTPDFEDADETPSGEENPDGSIPEES